MNLLGRRWWSATLALCASVLSACDGHVAVEALPSTRATLTRVGKRLSRSRSAAELSKLAPRGDLVLAELTRAERDALGRGYLRFRVDGPAIVEVAANPQSLPFWLADEKFARTSLSIGLLGERWPLFRKFVDPGWVGLGVNSLDRTAAAHYLVFVRPTRSKGSPLNLNAVEPCSWIVTEAREGTSATFDAHMPIDRLPDELKGATLLQPSRKWRNASALAKGRVWKTHVVSRRIPDQVAIAFGPDPARSLIWTWRTAPDVTSTAVRLVPVLKAGAIPDESATLRLVSGEAQTVELPDLLNDPIVLRHRVTVSGLRPDTVYAYSLGDGTTGGWSSWRFVRTAPSTPRNYRFLYLGDAQCGLEGWGQLLRRAWRRNPDAGFLLLAGDLVDRGNERTNWDHFFLRAEGVLDSVPFMPCAGNHEYLDKGPWLYSAFFDLPRNGPSGIDPKLVYSFEYGNAFVAVLDSTLAVADRRMAEIQAKWLDSALGKSQATWKFVMFHHPLYASHRSRENLGLRDAWLPVFDRHHVDLVLQGHDHAYLRTYPMRANQRVASSAQGTTYVVSVSGDKYYEQDPRDYTEVGLTNLSTYQTIDIDVLSNRLTYRAWDVEGREVDSLVIDKPRTLSRVRPTHEQRSPGRTRIASSIDRNE